ncbi:hypothetical protein BS47DRAFT_1295146 [Hydnum rufescens UP504]|uniref:Pheromone receptor n=1 Tax=Hydnum rufescens UP504 TaxID=1448309 RepID=A0A9P6AYZ2_9AGAM|nr:hypothetical protein BS47DRAFT_1295146 [Hydnum rufescens UP504]
MSSEQIAFIVISGIALILILLPLPWHWSARNYGTLLYIGWAFSGTLMYFINAIVWTGNLKNPAPVWCDISAKLAMGLGVALPAVSLCINRRLFNIATMKIVELSPRQRLHQTLIDFGIGLGIPILVMILHYVVQGHRFDIIEDVGCVPCNHLSHCLMIPLVLIWPLLLGLVSMVYGVLAMRAFMKQRRTFSTLLNSKSSNLNVSRYLRLMALAGTDITLDLPLSSYIAYSNLRHGLAPWVSWSDTHYNFSDVNYVPKSLLQEVPGAWATLTINRWALPMACILFFLFFGLAGESIAFYQRVIRRSIALLHLPYRSHAKLQVTASSPQGFVK